MDYNTPIREIMSKHLITVSDLDPIEKVKSLIKRRSIHHVPVEDEEGNLLGIVSSEDIIRATVFPLPEEKLQVKHIMTVNVETMRMDTSVGKALEAFLKNRYRAIPVIDVDGVLVGIVTPYDILKLLAVELEIEH